MSEEINEVKSGFNLNFMKLHFTLSYCDEETDSGCRVTDLCHIALGFV